MNRTSAFLLGLLTFAIPDHVVSNGHDWQIITVGSYVIIMPPRPHACDLYSIARLPEDPPLKIVDANDNDIAALFGNTPEYVELQYRDNKWLSPIKDCVGVPTS